jgi:hypothetical protein
MERASSGVRAMAAEARERERKAEARRSMAGWVGLMANGRGRDF